MQKYTIQLSNGNTLHLDKEEVQGVLDKLALGQFIKVKQGIFNPAYFITLIKNDDETMKHTSKILHNDGKCRIQFKKYQDIFKEFDFSNINQKNKLSTNSNLLN